MRKKFFDKLYEEMSKDETIVLITADLGYGILDKIRTNYPERFFNVGAAEQTMLGVAIGFYYSGKKPFCYTITPFYERAFEAITLYLKDAVVKLIGSGVGNDYMADGISHWERTKLPLKYNIDIDNFIHANESQIITLKR